MSLYCRDRVVEVVNEGGAQDADRVGREHDDVVQGALAELGVELGLDHVGRDGDARREEEGLVGNDRVLLVVAGNGEPAVGGRGHEGQGGAGVAAKVERVDAERRRLGARVLGGDGGDVLGHLGQGTIYCHVGLGERIDAEGNA